MKKMNKILSSVLVLCLCFNIIIPITSNENSTIPFSSEKVYAISESDSNYWKYGGAGWTLTSPLWKDKDGETDGLWTWYVDGVNKGTMWCIDAPAGGGGYNTIGPNELSAWVSAFNGEYSYVQSRISSSVFTVKGPRDIGTRFNRYYTRDVAALCGATVPSWDSKTKSAKVLTTKSPFANVNKPYSLKAGDTGSFTIIGNAFVGSSLTYNFEIDGTSVSSGSSGVNLNKVVTKSLTAGTHTLTLELTDAYQRTTTKTDSITVTAATTPTTPPIGGNSPPSANFSMASSADTGETVDVTDSSSDSDGTIASRTWTVSPTSGVTNNLSTSGSGGTLKFSSTGSYDVTLKVTDNKGATDSMTRTIVIGEGYTPPPPPPPAPKYEPIASFGMTSAAGQGASVSVSNWSTDIDGTIVSADWSVSSNGGTQKSLGLNGGTITFNQTGTFTVTLTVTDNDGLTGTTSKQITITNQPPVAKMYIPDKVVQGNDFTISSGSYDPDGIIQKTTWTVSPNTGLVGTLNGTSNTVYFDTEGTYTITLTVEDKWGLSASETKTITVEPAIPNAAFDALGTYKQNRKVTLDSTFSNSPSRYPIDVSKTEWVITPLTAGVTTTDIKIDTATALNKRDILFKQPGVYNIKLRVWNAKHCSEWVEKQITIGKDEKPVANFFITSIVNRDPNNGNIATIPLTDMSYSTDGDSIVQRIWKYKFDSNNDGSFGDESWVTIDSGNKSSLSLQVTKVGNYLVELEVVEEFAEPTIAAFVTAADRQRADTSLNPIGSKKSNVTNINPFVDFDVSAKKKVDIVFTVGQADASKVADLSSKIATYVTSKLAANNIDVKISTIETAGMDIQNSFSWINNVHSGIGSISFQNGGSTVYMSGNTSSRGYNSIYTNSQDPNTNKQVMNFSYSLNYGDNFDGAGVLLNTNLDASGNMNGYALMFMQDGVARLFKITNWTNSAYEEIYIGNYWSNQINSKATLVGTLSMGSSGSYIIETTKTQLTVKYSNGSVIGTINLPTHYGWGFGFFSDHYDHGCDNIGQFALTGISMQVTKGKTLDEVLKEPSWREGASHFLVNVNDVQLGELNDPDKVAVLLTKMASDSLDFDVLGTSANQAQIQTFIAKNSGNGVFYDNTNMNTAMDNLGTYILNKVLAAAKNNIKYVLLGEEVEYSLYTNDYENDPEYARRWIYQHDANYFQNSLGVAAYNNTYLASPVTTFDKVGAFVAQFQIRDNPVGTDNRFDEYRLWSGMPLNGLTIYVHRKPIAKFNISAVPNASTGQFDVSCSESSYDLDHQYDAGKGIMTKEWMWKNTNDSSWTYGPPPSSLPANNNYIVQLRVRDIDGPEGVGAWSDPEVQYVTTKNLNIAPIALFEVSPNPLPLGKAVTFTDNSYDPNGDAIAQRSWVVEKNNLTIYSSTVAPTTANFTSWGIGDYKITLKVYDTPKAGSGLPMWSEPYSQTLLVVAANQKPVAAFSVSPNPVPLDYNVTYTDTSSDPDGDPLVLREWRWKYTTDATWTNGSTPPTNFTGYHTGVLQIQLRVKDQPVLPQQDALYSDWTERQLTLIAGNQKPVARFTVTPNPAPADEPIVYNDTSYDPEGKAITNRTWTVKCNETGQTYQFDNVTPPTVFETTGWGANADGVGTYTITLKVKDTSPNGLSPALWSDVATQTLVVEDALRITGLKMTNIVNGPAGTVVPITYPVAAPTSIKAGYKMTFVLNTNGGDTAAIKVFANGTRLTVYTDAGSTQQINVATTRKNSVSTFTFWVDKDLPVGTVLDMKIELTKTKLDGTTKTLIDTVLGNQFGVIVGSSKQDSSINLTN